MQEDNSMMDSWHDLTSETDDTATKVVAALGSVSCPSPVSALLVAFHAVLVQQFRYTCLEEASSSAAGFAPPERKLAPDQFLPTNWASNKLRYRTPGTNRAVTTLTIEAEDEGGDLVLVKLGAKEWTLSLSEHVNLESWNRAALGGSAVAPALHFKGLAALLTKFAAAFGLDKTSTSSAAPYLDYTMQQPQQTQFAPQPHRLVQPLVSGPATGHFAGDLTPTGLIPAGYPSQTPMVGGYTNGNLVPPVPGNLMGPGHPMFGGSAAGMQPRRDPFGPPGGPTELDPQNHPGGTGNPNNDLAQPPFFFSNNMFM